jgi:hypothetical protein
MARLMIGAFLILLFALSLVAMAAFRPPYWLGAVLLTGVFLLIPGIALIVTGRRRVALFKKVGQAVLAAARETGHVNIADISAQTQTSPDQVRMVITALSKLGAMPRDAEVS